MAIVLKVTPSQLATMKNNYLSNTTIPTGAIFRHKGNNVMITGYKSGKVMFQGPNEDLEAKKWTDTTTITSNGTNPKSKSSSPSSNIPTNLGNLSVLGSDEVGTGSYFGPLTVAAVYVPKEHIQTLQGWGIADSKTLTDLAISELAEKIVSLVPYHVVNILPVTYNQYNKTMNANEIKAHGHNHALSEVLKKISPIQPNAVLIDQFTPPTAYWRYLKNTPQVIKDDVIFATKAEQLHVAVAAASIIARYVELQTLRDLSKQAQQHLPVGAGTKVDHVAADLLEQKLPLENFAKLHFANTQKAQHILQQRK